MYKHGCLENIKKLDTNDLKEDDQQQYKDIIEAAMKPTPERFTDNSLTSTVLSVTIGNTNVRTSLLIFTEVCISKIELPPTGWVLINQILIQLEQALCCSQVFKI